MKSYMEAFHLALGQDNSIAVNRTEIDKSPGFTESYLNELGLEKRFLLKLERKGLAIRGRTKNIWMPGETLPSGHVCEKGSTYRAKGSETRWILIRGES